MILQRISQDAVRVFFKLSIVGYASAFFVGGIPKCLLGLSHGSISRCYNLGARFARKWGKGLAIAGDTHARTAGGTCLSAGRSDHMLGHQDLGGRAGRCTPYGDAALALVLRFSRNRCSERFIDRPP